MGKSLKNTVAFSVLSIFIAFIGISFISSPAQALGLNLFSPEVNGRTVKVNGVAEGGSGPLYWDWGDGTTEHSYFPNQHTYSNSGNYRIGVTLSGSGGQSVTRYKTVEIGTDETADITVDTEDIADGTRLSFRIPSSITEKLARGSMEDARVCSKIILEKIDNLPGGDMGISIANAIARGKIAWDLVASSRHYVDEYGFAVNWYYVIERHEDEWWCPKFLLPVVDKIASKWAEFSNTPAADIVGYASDSIDKIGQLEEAFLPVKSE